MKSWLVDVFGIVGAGLITTGATLIYVPAGFITGGVLLLAAAVLAARHGGTE
jgi:hypothetical protein